MKTKETVSEAQADFDAAVAKAEAEARAEVSVKAQEEAQARAASLVVIYAKYNKAVEVALVRFEQQAHERVRAALSKALATANEEQPN